MITPKEALEGLIEAVTRDANEPGGRGISGYTSARLSDAKSALASLEGDAVERVARMIEPYCPKAHVQYKAAVVLAERILATGLAAGEAERPLGDVFNELVRRMNFDGMDPRTFTLGELERAIDGAEFPK